MALAAQRDYEQNTQVQATGCATQAIGELTEKVHFAIVYRLSGRVCFGASRVEHELV
jgi:hypothetical protein